MIEQSLALFGLRDEEITTFLFLLEHGPHTAGTLAQKTGLARPSLYGFLQNLKEAGFVTESQKNGIKVFQPQNIKTIESIIDSKISKLETSKKTLESLYGEFATKSSGFSPRFQLFEGIEGLQFVLRDMLLYRDIETLAYWPIKSMLEVLSSDFFLELNRERIKMNLSTRAIWPESQIVDIRSHPYLGHGKKFLREIRTAPSSIAFSMGYWIYGNKVACISSKREAFGFIIESRELVEMLTSQFNAIWELSRPINASESDGDAFFPYTGF